MRKTTNYLFLILAAVALWGSGIIPAIIPQSVPLANKQGNSTKFQLAGTNTGTAAAPLCNDANGNTTTSGCTSFTGSLIYYWTNTASDISTYLQATAAPYTPKTTKTYAALATGTDTLQNWATNAGIPNLTFIPTGAYSCHVHALRTGGGTVNVRCQIWEVSAVGVDIGLIGTTEASVALGTSETEYTLLYVSSSPYVMASSASRIVARVQAIVSGSSPTVQIFVGQTADSDIALPSPTVDATNFVPYTGATKDLDLSPFHLLDDSLSANMRISSFGASFDGAGSALTAGKTVYTTVPSKCTISAWNITVDTGTATIDIWRVASGVNIPTVSDSITASALPAISSNTAIHSTVTTGWCGTGTCLIGNNDIIGINLQAVASATYANLVVECDK